MVSFNSFTNNKATKGPQNDLNVHGVKPREGFTCLARCILVFLNSLVLLCAFILIGLGVGQHQFYSTISQITTTEITLVALGLIIGIIAFFGFFGALQEHVCMLKMYAVTLIIIEVTLSNSFYVAIVYRLIPSKIVIESILGFLYENKIFHVVSDTIHTTLYCCGVDGPQGRAVDFDGNKTLFGSCCINTSKYYCSVDGAYQQSCTSQIDIYYPQILAVASKIVLMLGALQLICAALAYFIIYVVKRRVVKYERIPEVFTISNK